jgi:uncharacterized repeat protein (TIGR01451 family)
MARTPVVFVPRMIPGRGSIRRISMPRLSQRGLPLALALGLVASLVGAAVAGVQVNLTAHRVTSGSNGKEVLAAGDKARPGEVVEYQALYTNESADGVRQLVATLPIPDGMEYLPRTAVPAQVQASLDGSSFAAVPLRRKVKLADGREVMRDVPTSEYRWLRWTLGSLEGKGQEAVRARVRVNAAPPAPPVTVAR